MKNFSNFKKVRINFKAGRGGDGATVFFQDWMQKKPLPQGGDGGKGGDVVLIADIKKQTFDFFKNKIEIKADDGQNGNKSNRHGKNGKNLIIFVPVGTLIFDSQEKELLFNFEKDGEKFVILKGGIGGFGNARLSKKHRKAINYSLSGSLGQEKELVLDLRVLSHVSLIGLPNVGKTSLLNAISRFKGKVGNYSFTTLHPNLAWIYNENRKEKILISDLPGIIENAHLNKGLGNKFLKHAQHCYLFLHLVDLNQPKSKILREFNLINNELFKYNKYFAEIPQIIVGTKSDLSINEKKINLSDFDNLNFSFLDFISVSSTKNINLSFLKNKIFSYFNHNFHLFTVMDKMIKNNNWDINVYKYEPANLIKLRKVSDNTWELETVLIDSFLKNTDLKTEKDLNEFNKYLVKTNIKKRLESEGVKKNDLIYLGKKQFFWKN